MVHKDKSRYTHFYADSPWRIMIQDEPGDVVISVHHRDEKEPGGWIHVARVDESNHDSFHAHIPPDEKVRIEIGKNLSTSEKLKAGMNFLKSMASQNLIFYGGDYLSPKDVHEDLIQQVSMNKAPKGSTSINVSITGTALVVQGHAPTIKVSKGKDNFPNEPTTLSKDGVEQS
jgi:hypothetical protein